MIRSRGIQILNHLLKSTNGRTPQNLPLFLRDSPRHFSTRNEHQPLPQHPHSPTPIDSFLHPPSPGLVYGRLFGISANTLKTDIINLFEGSNLTLDDIKVEYNRIFHPMAMLVQFRSMADFSAAFRELTRRSRSFRMEKVVDHRQWDLVTPYNGRYVLFQGIPRNALPDDIDRLLSGCNYEASSLEIFVRPLQSGPIRMATVRFPSPIEAMNAVIRKNGAFCLNNRVLAQLIQ
ncbi:hypothetical protein BVRB_7g162420 [Beta vulgaris subsp. vulgaris]|uniref:uncharacterized protein LOC104898764 n=1 Tax=Beta vulgaris subsp. vulgaris TaxID=3555 RepID=UPI00054011A9|nr:uncharacterized protein LOC104898764 [Beta vulgaris subsp. vulgaris]KMT06169.1 hypothetical protein BVRB_7g162420 [Beta vulgaris subsp. vulgaris]